MHEADSESIVIAGTVDHEKGIYDHEKGGTIALETCKKLLQTVTEKGWVVVHEFQIGEETQHLFEGDTYAISYNEKESVFYEGTFARYCWEGRVTRLGWTKDHIALMEIKVPLTTDLEFVGKGHFTVEGVSYSSVDVEVCSFEVPESHPRFKT